VGHDFWIKKIIMFVHIAIKCTFGFECLLETVPHILHAIKKHKNHAGNSIGLAIFQDKFSL